MLGKKLHVKKGDTVMVIAGKDKSKTGKLLSVVAKKDGVLVEGVNMVKRHTRARGNQPGGILEKEAPVHVSNVMPYCGKCCEWNWTMRQPIISQTHDMCGGKQLTNCLI